MNAIDWTILAVIMLSVFLATMQGFFFEIFSLAGTCWRRGDTDALRPGLCLTWNQTLSLTWLGFWQFFSQSFCWQALQHGLSAGQSREWDCVGQTGFWEAPSDWFEA